MTSVCPECEAQWPSTSGSGMCVGRRVRIGALARGLRVYVGVLVWHVKIQHFGTSAHRWRIGGSAHCWHVRMLHIGALTLQHITGALARCGVSACRHVIVMNPSELNDEAILLN